MIAIDVEAPASAVIVSRHYAAFAAGDRFARMERETADARAPGWTPLVAAAGRAGCVLDDETAPAGTPSVRPYRRETEQMHAIIALVRLPELGLPRGVNIVGVGADVHKHRRAPQWTTTLAVATQVKAGTITSSPGPIPAAISARCRAVVHEVGPARMHAWRAANAASNLRTQGPWVSQPDLSTARTASSSSSPIMGLAIGNGPSAVIAGLRLLIASWVPCVLTPLCLGRARTL